jgi:purine nucleosidase
MKTRLSWILLLALFSNRAWGKTAVFLSTDIGNEIDDQWAVTYMLTNPDFDVRGILSANAPSLPDPSAHATYEILVDLVERRLGMLSHPPLFEGSSAPLTDLQTAHGNAGVDFLVKSSKEFSKDRRLVVLTIGAATDVASSILQDPTIVDRISVVAMGFRSLEKGGEEYNIQNDPKSWQVILNSKVPVTIGAGDVCQRDLTMGYEQAHEFLGKQGAMGAYLWNEYQGWYFRNIKPLRKNDFSKPWIIWDIITLAFVEGMTTQKEIPRPRLLDNLSFEDTSTNAGTITWITGVDSKRLWGDFAEKLQTYSRMHVTGLSPCLIPRQ